MCRRAFLLLCSLLISTPGLADKFDDGHARGEPSHRLASSVTEGLDEIIDRALACIFNHTFHLDVPPGGTEIGNGHTPRREELPSLPSLEDANNESLHRAENLLLYGRPDEVMVVKGPDKVWVVHRANVDGTPRINHFDFSSKDSPMVLAAAQIGVKQIKDFSRYISCNLAKGIKGPSSHAADRNRIPIGTRGAYLTFARLSGKTGMLVVNGTRRDFIEIEPLGNLPIIHREIPIHLPGQGDFYAALDYLPKGGPNSLPTQVSLLSSGRHLLGRVRLDMDADAGPSISR